MLLAHGISQARILERIIIFFYRGSFQPRDWIRVSCISYVWQADSLPTELSGKPKYMSCKIGIINSLRGMREWIKNPLFYWLKNRARVVNKKKTPWYLIGQGQSRTVKSKKLKKKMGRWKLWGNGRTLRPKLHKSLHKYQKCLWRHNWRRS